MQNSYTINTIILFLISCIAVLGNHSESEGKKSAKTHCATSHVFPDRSLLDKNSWAQGLLPQLAELMSVDAYYNHYIANGVSPDCKKKLAERFIYWENKGAETYKRCYLPEANGGRW